MFVIGTGNLGKDIVEKVAANGKSYCEGSIGWSESMKTENGWENTPTIWIWFRLFGQQATYIAQSLRKGDRVEFSGRLCPELWKNSDQPVLTLINPTISPSLKFTGVKVHRASEGRANQQAYVASRDWPEPSNNEQPPF